MNSKSSEAIAEVSPQDRTQATHLDRYSEEIGETMSAIEEVTLEWILTMEWYCEQLDRGISALVLRYVDLINLPEQTPSKIFSYCNLPLNAVRPALKAYSRDSQASTPLGRENTETRNQYRLNETQIKWVTRILKQHPTLILSNRVSFPHEKATRGSDRAWQK